MANPSDTTDKKPKSEGLKAYWDSPEGRARRLKASERMAGNTNAKKNKPQYIPPGETGGAGAKTSTSPPGEGAYAGVDPAFKPKTGQEQVNAGDPPRQVKPISNEKFQKAWPKFLLRLHRGFTKVMMGVSWAANLVFHRFFPEKNIVITIDEYTKEEAELDRELTELVIEEDLALWISKNRWKAFMIGTFAWFFGGIDVKIENKKKKEDEENGKGNRNAPGLAGSASDAGNTAAAGDAQNG